MLRRFLILRATRWLPTGFLIPILVLFVVDRGLTLAQIGLVAAAQGVVVFLLELPTGGLADALGRRRALLLANLFALASLTLIYFSVSPLWFAVAFALQGFYRALESGPLDSWYVDASHEVDPDADVERGLSLGGVALGLAIASGAVLSGALVALQPISDVEPLATPILAALALRIVDTGLLYRLMFEVRPPLGRDAMRESLTAVPGIIASALRLARTTRALRLILAVELFWGFGMVGFEVLFPVRLGEVLGNLDEAAALMGPTSAGAWVASSAGAAILPWLTSRLGRHNSAALMRVLQGGTVLAMAIFGGVAGLITAYLACLAVHGASSPAHLTLLHEQAEASIRTTVMSMNSMTGHAASAIGGIVLGAISDSLGVPTGMTVAALVLVAAAPLYLMAAKAPRR